MRRTRALAAIGAIGVAAALALAGCSTSDSGGNDGDSGGPSTPAAKAQTLTVYAAASLQPTFTKLASAFEAGHPNVTVRQQFAGSADLLTQLKGGAPADILATADAPTMEKAVTAGLVDDSTPFASNRLTIAVEPGNPKKVASLNDLTKPGMVVVVCAPQVPCGAATKKVTRAAHVTLKPVSETTSVTDVVSAVTSGEADAGLVYVTDAQEAGKKLDAVDFPESALAINEDRVAVLKDAKASSAAREFIDLLTSSKGKAVLAEAGFSPPAAAARSE